MHQSVDHRLTHQLERQSGPFFPRHPAAINHVRQFRPAASPPPYQESGWPARRSSESRACRQETRLSRSARHDAEHRAAFSRKARIQIQSAPALNHGVGAILGAPNGGRNRLKSSCLESSSARGTLARAFEAKSVKATPASGSSHCESGDGLVTFPALASAARCDAWAMNTYSPARICSCKSRSNR